MKEKDTPLSNVSQNQPPFYGQPVGKMRANVNEKLFLVHWGKSILLVLVNRVTGGQAERDPSIRNFKAI